MVTLRAFVVIGLVAASACTKARTEVVLAADTEYAVPSAMDELFVSVEGPDGSVQTSMAMIGSAADLPQTLGLAHTGGALGPFTVTLSGRLLGSEVASRVARFDFRSGETLTLHLVLTPRCSGVACPPDETCAGGSCRPVQVDPAELTPWTNPPSRIDGGVAMVDSGYDGNVCLTVDPCNFIDDDCDGMTDEDVDTTSDVMNCGRCGRVCDFQNTTGSCTAGECVIGPCDMGFDNCDGNPANGCETELGTSFANCGSCGNSCSPPDRACCAGSCARGC